MTALVVLGLLVAGEVAFFVLHRSRKERSLAWLIFGALFLLLLFTPVIDWGFAWFGIALLLTVESVRAFFVLKSDKQAKPVRVRSIILKSTLYIFLVTPLMLFPGTRSPEVTGPFAVTSETYTWVDESRDEEFTEIADSRSVTVQFWYPASSDGSYPLLVFSHGAFGYRMSNHSTFMELASHGYVVCSIDHPYHSFMTRQPDGVTIRVDLDFLKRAMAVENGTIQGGELHALEQAWMTLRTADMHFVIDTIRKQVHDDPHDNVFAYIDSESIGVFGHSMGGATAAAIGRERDDVDAVIVLNGTMMGETVGYSEGAEEFLAQSYPTPILNLYNEEHGVQASILGDTYPNMYMHSRSDCSYQVSVRGSGHLNFTDLPLVSPVLARVLGVGSVDPDYCVKTMNALVLEFFDRNLKGSGVVIARERSY